MDTKRILHQKNHPANRLMLWRICLPQVSWYIRCFQARMRCCLHNRIPQTGYYPATLQKGFPTRPILSSGDMRARPIPLRLRRFWFAGWTRPVTVRFGKRYSSLPLPDVRLSAFYCCDRLFPNIGKRPQKISLNAADSPHRRRFFLFLAYTDLSGSVYCF